MEAVKQANKPKDAMSKTTAIKRSRKKGLDFSKIKGKLSFKGDAIATQRMMRDE